MKAEDVIMWKKQTKAILWNRPGALSLTPSCVIRLPQRSSPGLSTENLPTEGQLAWRRQLIGEKDTRRALSVTREGAVCAS